MMKKIILVLSTAILYSCDSQSLIANKKIKKQNIEYFNIDKYKDWEIDTDHSSYAKRKFLKKENDRVEINFFDSGIKVSLTNLNTGYEKVKGFSNVTKGLIIESNNFCDFSIGKDTYYDENGRILKEIDNDIDYKFSVDELIKKIQKEYGLNINKKNKTIAVRRWMSSELDNKPLYCVFYYSNNDSPKWKYILIDGSTGETLFTTLFILNDYESLSPFDKYLESLKKQEAEDNTYFTTYNGKDYTKKEWEIFKEEWHKNHEENKNKGFWDDIFKRSGNN